MLLGHRHDGIHEVLVLLPSLTTILLLNILLVDESHWELTDVHRLIWILHLNGIHSVLMEDVDISILHHGHV